MVEMTFRFNLPVALVAICPLDFHDTKSLIIRFAHKENLLRFIFRRFVEHLLPNDSFLSSQE